MTRHAAYELAPDKIRVNAVCPARPRPAFGGGQVPSAERKAARAKKIPLGRMVEPQDIADAVLFLASDASRMCTGIALDVDGGVLISNDIPYEEYFARARKKLPRTALQRRDLGFGRGQLFRVDDRLVDGVAARRRGSGTPLSAPSRCRT